MAKAKKKNETEIPQHIMNDLCCRFVINVAEDMYLDSLRVFYITECAYWHYLDFYWHEQPELPKLSHKAITRHIFAFLPELQHFLDDFENLYHAWSSQKREIPSYGAILLSPDDKHVLMVQGFSGKNSWGFPKGKMELSDQNCEEAAAAREVEEETGIDITKLIRSDAYVEYTFQDQYTRLYIIPGIRMDTQFQPKLRKEIRDFRWYPIDALPTHKNDPVTKMQIGMEPSNFFRVTPYIKPLRRWISQKIADTQPMPASQFTAQGRNRKGKDGTRRQGQQLGPQGDAPASREGQSRGGGQSHVARNLAGQFNDAAADPSQQNAHIQILSRGNSASCAANVWKDQYQDMDNKAGKGKTKATEKATNVGRLRLDEFHSKALLNFKLDMDAIIDCLKW